MLALHLAAAPAVPPPPEAGYALAKTLDLTATFQTKTPWTMTIFAPTGPDAATSDKPVQVCLTGGEDDRTDCTKSVEAGYKFQTFEAADVQVLSSAIPLKAAVVRVSFSGGSHSLHRTSIWAYDRTGDRFTDTGNFDFSDDADTRRFAAGALDGYYVEADHVWTYLGENWWSPHRYAVTIYKLDTADPTFPQYIKMLTYLTSKRFNPEREHEGVIIDHELPRIKRLLKVVYPKGALF